MPRFTSRSTISSRFLVVLATSTTLLACSGDDSSSTNPSGASGQSGNGGQSGNTTGGSSGSSGSGAAGTTHGGQAGTGGSAAATAGTGGSNSGGTGAGSQGGSAGNTAGTSSGGSSNGGSSGSGNGGSSGAGGWASGVPQTPSSIPCVHMGTGRDIQVGNPSVESESNITQVASIGDVDWNNLSAGDTVRIFWREEPYREKFIISTSGTEEQPIRVCGVPGPSGQLPHISGENATTRADLAYGDLSNSMEDLSIVNVYNPQYEIRPEHIWIEGLHISNTHNSPGAAADAFSYVATDGSTREYLHGAACIRIQKARNLILRGNEIDHCANGIFILSRVPEFQVTRQVIIEGNFLHDNGLTDEEGVHSAYLQGIDMVVQYNIFGPTRPGAMGNTLKMRVAGDVIRYNYLGNGARIFDLVEVEDHAQLVIPELFAEFQQDDPAEVDPGDAERVLAAWEAYHRTYAYGNLVDNSGEAGATHIVHYSFDNTQNDRRPGTLWFYHNTILSRTNFVDQDFVRLVDQGPWWGNSGPAVTHNNYEDYATVQAINNAIFVMPQTPGEQAAYFEFTRYRADKLNLGANWIMTGWDTAVPGWGQMFPGFGNALVDNPDYVYPGGNDSHHVTGTENLITGSSIPFDVQSFVPNANGPLKNAAQQLPADIPAEHVPLFQLNPVTGVVEPRPSYTTIGAVE